MASQLSNALAPPPPIDRAAATPPVAPVRPHRTEIHGRERVDDYFWLRHKSDPEVTNYLEAENAYANAVMEPTQELQQRLYDEMLSHIKQTDLSVPYRLGDYWYYARTEEGKQYPIYARKRDEPDAAEQVTLDLNELAAGHAYLGLGAYQVSDDGNFLAYSLDTTGYRQYTLHVKDLRSGEDLDESIPRAGDVVWASDNRTLFYTTEDEVTKRHDCFWRKHLGAVDATLLYEERDALYDIGAARSNDRRYIFVASFSRATAEWRYVPAGRPNQAPTVVLERSEGHRYSVEHYDGSFYIVTNRGAEDFRLVAAPVRDPAEANWREMVPARDGVHLGAFDVFEHRGVLRVRSGGFANLEIFDFASGALEPVRLPETVHAVFPQANPEFHTGVYRYSYSSLVTPNCVYEVDLQSGVQTLLKATEVPGYDPALYDTELVHATARDGTAIPISLVSRRGVARDRSAPLLLYGYGSYGISMDPTFSPARLVLLDRGVVYAIAHIRGGGELGERWRTSGHLQQKLNTFTDFIDCAEHLIAQGYTAPARLAISGGSAGGLLVGAVSNMRPDLFAAVVSQVPFVDVLNTMLDESLPLTTGEYLEWGNPNVPGDYDYIARYSPYDNVGAHAYPATLVRVSLHDSQVPYWEGAKLVARLRACGTGERPILLVTNFGAGHGGASGRYDYLREIAFNYAFVLALIAPAV
jgi:oligopeptidase B